MASINKPLTIDSNILMSSNRDLEDVHSPYDDAFVIKVQISNTLVSQVLVDNVFRVNILFKDVVEKMGIIDNINKKDYFSHLQRSMSWIAQLSTTPSLTRIGYTKWKMSHPADINYFNIMY